MTNFDFQNKPTLKQDEAMCTACWKVVKKNQQKGWHYISFKHLEAVNLCVECQPEWKEHNLRIQGAGL